MHLSDWLCRQASLRTFQIQTQVNANEYGNDFFQIRISKDKNYTYTVWIEDKGLNCKSKGNL